MKRIILLLCLLPCYVAAQTIYTWVDENGVTHFGDKPRRGAKVMELSPPPPSSDYVPAEQKASQSAQADSESTAEKKPAAKKMVSGVSIKAPTNEETIRNNMGNVPVSVRLKGGELGKKQSLQLMVDGRARMSPQESTSWLVSNLPRGEHLIAVQLLKDGKVIATSQTIKVFVHRPIARKKKAN